ncbi:exo-rhamnogalacturonan lyase family protein [Micromonospora sp. CPCC 206061]|uniref:exo-rhamnogalacturonan lyase family protein n=1 Tax=Micromonospora sp. CPCC 206061 TaxID=3122410 RepID=UPI002FEF21CF
MEDSAEPAAEPSHEATDQRGSRVSRRLVLRTTAATAAAVPFANMLAAPGAAAEEPQPPAPAEAGPATVRWLGGTPGSSIGTSFGVPWPKGAFTAGTQFTAADPAGAAVPLDTWPLAHWPDGSLKWTGHAVGANSGLTEQLIITAGRPVAPSRRVTVNESTAWLEVNTGVIRARIMKTGPNLIQALSRGDKQLAKQGRLVLQMEDRSNADNGTIKTVEYAGTITQASVEHLGDSRAVILVKGTYNKGSRKVLPFTVRLYFYTGAESLRLVHYFIFDGDHQTDFIKGLGLTWQVPMVDEVHNRHVRFVGTEGGIWGEAVRVMSGLRRDAGSAVTSAQFNGVATPPVSAWPANVRAELDDVPIWNDYKLVQASPDAFHVAKRTGAHSTWLLHAGHGKRAAGLGYVGGVSGGVAFGLKDFWQRFPTQLDIRDASTDTANATIWFWSPDAPAMDLRHYDNKRHGLNLMYEEPGRGIDDICATPEGVARSHEVTLWALAATPTRARLVELAKEVREPARLVATPDYLYERRVFGKWGRIDRSTAVRTTLENSLDASIAFYQRQVDQRHWYGFWHFGDVMHSYDGSRHTWKYDQGGFAWQNGELNIDMFLWYQFLRSGRADVFAMAEAMTLHMAEADSYHAGPFAGLGSRHNVVHWGDGAKEARVSASVLKRVYYYLSADERVGDYMRNMLQVGQTLLSVEPLRQILPPPTAPTRVRIGPDWTAVASNWLVEWERTGDTRYRDLLLRGMQDIGAMQYGFFSGPASAVGFDPATGALTSEGNEFRDGYNLMLLFGGDQFLYELVELLDVPAFKEHLVKYALYVNGTATERVALYGRNFSPGTFNQFYSRMLAWVGEERGDNTLKQRAWTGMNPNSGNMPPVQTVSGTTVLTPVEYVPGIFTNDVGQRGLTVIQLMGLAREQAP